MKHIINVRFLNDGLKVMYYDKNKKNHFVWPVESSVTFSNWDFSNIKIFSKNLKITYEQWKARYAL